MEIHTYLTVTRSYYREMVFLVLCSIGYAHGNRSGELGDIHIYRAYFLLVGFYFRKRVSISMLGCTTVTMEEGFK